jgi:hypothetical protein
MTGARGFISMIFICWVTSCSNGQSTPVVKDADATLPSVTSQQSSQALDVLNAFNGVEAAASKASQCSDQVTPSQPNATTPSGAISAFHHIVSGASCPVSLDHELTLSFDSSEDHASGSLSFNYSASSGHAGDIQLVSISGPLVIDHDLTKMELSGSIQSATQGQIGFTLSAEGNQTTSAVRITYEFPSYTIKARAFRSADGSVRYFLNRDPIDSNQFSSYVPEMISLGEDL